MRLKEEILPAVFAVLAPILPLFLIFMTLAIFAKVNDLPEFYAAARMFLDGRGANIYVTDHMFAAQHAYFPAMGERQIHFMLAPFALPLIIPVAAIPIAFAPVIWTVILIAASVASAFALQRIYQLNRSQTFWLIAVFSVFGPLYEAIRIGQLAPLLLLALCGAIVALKRDKPIIFGLCASVLLLKPQELAPLVVFLLGAGKYKHVACLAAVGAVMALVSILVIGVPGYQGYAQLMSSSGKHWIVLQAHLNPTVRGQLLLFFPQMIELIEKIATVLFVFALGFIYWLGRVFRNSDKWVDIALMASIPLGCVLAIYMQYYDLVLMVPVILSGLKSRTFADLPEWSSLVALLVLFPFILPFSVYLHYDYLLKGFQINFMFWSLLFATIATLIVLLKKDSLRRPSTWV